MASITKQNINFSKFQLQSWFFSNTKFTKSLHFLNLVYKNPSIFKPSYLEHLNKTQLIFFSRHNPKRFRKLVLDDDGNLRIYSFYPEQNNTWVVVWLGIWEMCKVKGKCGPNSICMPREDFYNSTFCVCPSGFEPVEGGTEKGCKRKIPISSNSNTHFVRLDYVNYTSGSMNQINASNYTICESNCTRDSSCLGFGFKYDGSGYCVLLRGKQLQYGYWSPGTELALFLRLDQKESEASNFIGMTEVMQTTCPVRISLPLPPKDSNTTTRNIVIICTLFAAELIAGVAFFWSFLKRYIKYRDMATTLGLELLPAGGPKRFTYSEIKAATNDFSNLIGKGGFGDVYKADPITSKADVYSFGMVLLELVSGVRNFEIQGSVARSDEWYFPGWAFDKMFKEMRVEEILDSQICHAYDSRAHFQLVNRMVKTAMWCLQDRPESRPTMGKVAKMIEGTVEIMDPKKPTVFFLGEE
ncbi:hypothetical protein P8452_06786 [Trifolium repens]|nr:hypothetical protein P8452_06786 [Trifolium repens]